MDEQDELTVLITVPEEFAGYAMNELQRSDGVVVDLNAARNCRYECEVAE
jgi:hypothetical protein